MFNVYPQRATDPNAMQKIINPEIHKANISNIDNILKDIQTPTIWASWGTLIHKRPYLPKCLKDIASCTSKYNPKWVSFGNISKHGHPHHPLYLSNASKPELFDIEGYCSMLF